MLFLKRYPKSLLRLILLGYAMVLVPLLGAGVYGVYAVTHLQRDGVAAIDSAVSTVRDGLQMADRLRAMERLIRQHVVLHEPALLKEYGLIRLQWQQAGATFGQLSLVGPLAADVKRLISEEDRAFQAYLANPESAAIGAALIAVLESNRDAMARNLSKTDLLLEGVVAHFREDAQIMVWRLVIVLLGALPLSLAIVVVFRTTFRSLLAQFEGAIRRLGRGNMDDEIRLDGPSDMRFIGRRLEWLRRRLRGLESQRNQFLRNVSHELKTPLAAVREGTQLLVDGVAGELSAQQRKVAIIMASSVRRLQVLIDDLLRLQQASFDAQRIQPRDVAVADLLRESLTAHQLTAKQRGIELQGVFDGVHVQGGSQQLRIVFDNLISNAIKYSPEGGCVKITSKLADQRALVEVHDEGPGICPDERTRIFEAFVRLRNTESIEGNGLGLAIAREFVAAHRGTIEVLDVEKGAHFRVSLPLQWQRG